MSQKRKIKQQKIPFDCAITEGEHFFVDTKVH